MMKVNKLEGLEEMEGYVCVVNANVNGVNHAYEDATLWVDWEEGVDEEAHLRINNKDGHAMMVVYINEIGKDGIELDIMNRIFIIHFGYRGKNILTVQPKHLIRELAVLKGATK
jgi:hypothetical protein